MKNYAGRRGVAQHTSTPHREADPDLKDQLYAAIDALAPIYRSVFVLYEIEGHTHEEIGALLGISGGASRVRFSRAVDLLRRRLKELQ